MSLFSRTRKPDSELHGPRSEREFRTIAAMILCYCRGVHRGSAAPCPECEELLGYARLRLQKCPFEEEKPTCAKCPIHCYQPQRREQIRTVMRYAGPRLFWRHPILTVRHFLDARRAAPPIPKRNPGST